MLLQLGPSLTVEDAQRLQQRFHPWSQVHPFDVMHNPEMSGSLLDAELLYVREVEKILERVATLHG